MRKLLIYWEKETIQVVSNGKIEERNYAEFVENPPKGKGILLINDEDVLTQQISLPRHQKIKLDQIMLHEAVELAQTEEKKLIFNWCSLGKEETEDIYLLFVLKNSDILPLLEHLKAKKLEIINIFCTLDLLIKIAQKYCEEGGNYFIFFNDNVVYFLAFKDNMFLFHRKVELAALPTLDEESTTWQGFVLEIKRSLFYTKQKFKLIPEKIKVLASPSWFNSEFSEKLKEELALTAIERIALSPFPWKQSPFLSLFMTDSTIIHYLISLLPSEARQEKRLKKIALILALVLTVGLSGMLKKLFSDWEIYQQKATTYFDVLAKSNQFEQKMVKYNDKLNYLNQLQNQVNEIKDFLRKRSFVQIYLETIPYILPKKMHLETISFSHTEKEFRLSLEGKVDVKKISQRGIIINNFLQNFEKLPFFTNVTFDTTKLFSDGKFSVNVCLKRIKYEG